MNEEREEEIFVDHRAIDAKIGGVMVAVVLVTVVIGLVLDATPLSISVACILFAIIAAFTGDALWRPKER